MNNLVRTSYKQEDVTILLKDLTDLGISAQSTEEREKLIQSGVHYSEMLPLEYAPTSEYIEIYNKALAEESYSTATAAATMSEAILEHKGIEQGKNDKLVIVSLARAGIPAGILCKRYINRFHPWVDLNHYSISIIRGKGIDINAMNYIAERHNPKDIVFMDGWTGKGAIDTVLKEAVHSLKANDPEKWADLSDELAVIADPANICKLCGTHEDLLIPSSCLNSTVSGLVSRTILNEKYVDVKAGDFHGAVYFGTSAEMLKEDKSYEFIDKIDSFFSIYDSEILELIKKKADVILDKDIEKLQKGLDVVKCISEKEGIEDVNKIKPGIGECTRVLLRRVPKKVLVNNVSIGEKCLEHIFQLCKERNVPIEASMGTGMYKVIGVIADLSDV